MGGGGVLGTLSDVVIVVALVVAVGVGALFVGGRIAPRAENKDPEVDNDEASSGRVSMGDSRGLVCAATAQRRCR